MKQPFDIEIKNITYAVFPEENDTYTIFKDGIEYMKIQKDTDTEWLKLDPDTEALIFDVNEEANLIGKEIFEHKEEEIDDEDY